MTNDASKFSPKVQLVPRGGTRKGEAEKEPISTFTTYFSFVLCTVEPSSSAWESTETFPCCLNNNHRIGEMPQQWKTKKHVHIIDVQLLLHYFPVENHTVVLGKKNKTFWSVQNLVALHRSPWWVLYPSHEKGLVSTEKSEMLSSYSVMRAVGAGSPSADTSPRGRGQETRNQPTGRTHLPSRQSGFSVAGAQSSSPWQHKPNVAPWGPQPQASCPVGNHDWAPPKETGGRQEMLISFIRRVTRQAAGEYR